VRWGLAISSIILYYMLSLIGVSAISTIVALYVWVRRSHRSAVLLLLAGVVWALGMALGIWSTDLATKLLWYKVQYMGIIVVPTGWLLYTLQYLGREKWLTRRTLSLLYVVPAATLLLVFTNELHGLVFGSVELSASSPFLVLRLGLWFWIFVAYSYQQLLLAAALALQTLIREPRLFRRQAVALLFTVTCPLLASIAIPLGFDLLPSLTPLVYLTVGIILVLLNPMRLRIGDILPVAHDVVVRGMADAVIVLDDQNRILSLNPAAKDLIGCSSPDITGRPLEQVWAAWPNLACIPSDEFEVGSEITLNMRGERRTYDTKISRLEKDGQGQAGTRVIVMRDSTERRQAHGKLENSLSLLSATLESTADGILTVDKKRRVTNYNRRFVEMFGIPHVVLDSNLDYNIVAFIQRQMKDPRSFIRTTEELFEHPELDRPDILELGDGRIYERYSRPHLVGGEIVGRVASFRDITERVRMEKTLQDQAKNLQELVEEKTKELVRSQQLLETTLESAPDFVYMKDKDMKYIYVNNSYCKFFGKTREQILGNTVYELYPKEQADIFTQEDRLVFEKGSSVFSPDLAITDVEGQVHTVNAIKTPVKDAEGNVTHLVGITRDITDRKRMEEMKDRFIAAARAHWVRSQHS